MRAPICFVEDDCICGGIYKYSVLTEDKCRVGDISGLLSAMRIRAKLKLPGRETSKHDRMHALTAASELTNSALQARSELAASREYGRSRLLAGQY